MSNNENLKNLEMSSDFKNGIKLLLLKTLYKMDLVNEAEFNKIKEKLMES